jgi:hypothetical protein
MRKAEIPLPNADASLAQIHDARIITDYPLWHVPTRNRFTFCRSCGCDEVSRVNRQGILDWLMSKIGFRPHYCYACGRNSYKILKKGQS